MSYCHLQDVWDVALFYLKCKLDKERVDSEYRRPQ